MAALNYVPKPAITWPSGPSMGQNFSFPDTVVHYFSMNPSSPKVYSKLIQCCKFFFERNPILVIHKIEREICANEKCRCPGNPCCVKYRIENILSKFWIISKVDSCAGEPHNFIPLLRSKLYRSEIFELSIPEMIVEFDDFKFLTSTVKTLNLFYTTIVYPDGNLVMLDTILESIPNIERFLCSSIEDFSIFTPKTFQNILKLNNLENLKYFRLANIPETVNVNDLLQFVMDHKDAMFIFFFDDNISVDYSAQLDVMTDKIIESNFPNRSITYNGLDEEKHRILQERFQWEKLFNKL